MIVTLSGVTGTGKSFFKKQVVENKNFKNLVIVTTRKKRKGEIDGIDKYFVTENEFFKMCETKEIVFDFEFLGEYYGYRTIDVEDNTNQITELHYEYIERFRKSVKNVFSIYMIPNDFEKPKQELKNRGLNKIVEEQRLKEMEEQKRIFETNKKVQEQFDCIFYNDYTEESIKKLFQIIESEEKR